MILTTFGGAGGGPGGGGAAGASGGRPGGAGRLGPADDRQRQGPRHRARPRVAARRAGDTRAGRRGLAHQRQRRPRPHPHRHDGRAAGRRTGAVRQPAAAPQRIERPQRRVARTGRAGRPARLRVRHPRRRHADHRALRNRGRGLRPRRARLHRAGAAREPRRAGSGSQCDAAEAGRAVRHPRRPARTHDRLGRPREHRADGRSGTRAGLRVPRHNRPLGDARLWR